MLRASAARFVPSLPQLPLFGAPGLFWYNAKAPISRGSEEEGKWGRESPEGLGLPVLRIFPREWHCGKICGCFCLPVCLSVLLVACQLTSKVRTIPLHQFARLSAFFVKLRRGTARTFSRSPKGVRSAPRRRRRKSRSRRIVGSTWDVDRR